MGSLLLQMGLDVKMCCNKISCDLLATYLISTQKFLPLVPNMLPSSFLSFVACLGFGFSRQPRNLGGRPYLSMLSVNKRMAQMWIHALKACTQHDPIVLINACARTYWSCIWNACQSQDRLQTLCAFSWSIGHLNKLTYRGF